MDYTQPGTDPDARLSPIIYLLKCLYRVAGGPYEYLHSPQAMHLSNSTLFSKVQNLQDQDLNLATSLSLWVPQASHTSAIGCDNINPSEFW
jgi:hypothetical protein